MGNTPYNFVCPVARRHQLYESRDGRYSRSNYRYPDGHDRISRTGRTRPLTGRAGPATSTCSAFLSWRAQVERPTCRYSCCDRNQHRHHPPGLHLG